MLQGSTVLKFLATTPGYFIQNFQAGVLTVPVNLLNPTGHVCHQQFNIQQLYAPPTLYLCVLYLSQNKQRLFPYTA